MPGQVVGNSATSDSLILPSQHAFLWNGGTITDLGVPLGGTQSWAASINSAGLVAGGSTTSSGDFRGTVWIGATAIDLGAPFGGTRSAAAGINDAGQVVGGQHS